MAEIAQVSAVRQNRLYVLLDPLDSSIQRSPNRWLYGLLAAGFAVRIWHASGTYLNPDEALHFFVANKTSWWLTYRASLNVSHPPLLIFLLHIWRALGTSELTLRMPSILAGTVFCWFAYRWLAMLFDQGVAWIGFVLLLFLPSSIDLSTEVRQYALYLAFAMGSAYFLERALAKNSVPPMLMSGTLLWLAIGSHFSAFLFAASLGVYAIVRMVKERPPLKIFAAWEAGQIVALGICYFLYVTQLSRIGQAYGGTKATQGWMGNAYLGNSYFVPGKINPLLFTFARTGGVFQYLFHQSVIGDVAYLLFVIGMVLVFRSPSSAGRPTSRQIGLLLSLPFGVNCVAAVARLYPYGGTRHCSFLFPFAVAGIGVALAWLVRNHIALGMTVALLVALLCNVFPSKRLPYISPESQRKANMTAAIQFLRNAPSAEPIFVDNQTHVTLAHYVCDQRPIEPNHSVVGFVSYECDGHRVIASTTTFNFTARTFYQQWQSMVTMYRLPPGEKVWVAQMGWSIQLAPELANFPELHLHPLYFGDNLQIFDFTVGQSLPDPKLLPASVVGQFGFIAALFGRDLRFLPCRFPARA